MNREHICIYQEKCFFNNDVKRKSHKIFVIKRDMMGAAETIGNNAKLKDIAKIFIEEGSQETKEWEVKIVAEHDKNQIMLGMKPTGHYWFYFATWMIANEVNMMQVNP